MTAKVETDFDNNMQIVDDPAKNKSFFRLIDTKYESF
jgi:hypothetical protein